MDNQLLVIGKLVMRIDELEGQLAQLMDQVSAASDAMVQLSTHNAQTVAERDELRGLVEAYENDRQVMLATIERYGAVADEPESEPIAYPLTRRPDALIAPVHTPITDDV